MATALAPNSAEILQPGYSALQRWFVVAVLSLASIVSYIDRQIINLLVEPIKADLQLSDVDISLLQGFSFALLYAVLAIPLAWIADRHNRKWVIIGGLICWSMATFSSGLAVVFAALFAARMLVGIGEATLAPAGFSMISDYFPKEKLPLAISIMTGAGFLWSGIAIILGGYIISMLNELGPQESIFGLLQPWQLTFMAVTLLSVPVFILLLFIAEPKREEGNVLLDTADAPPALEIFSYLKSNAALYVPLFIGLAFFVAAQFGIGAWAPSYFIRVHGWDELQVGQAYGPVVMFCGLGGVVAGGFATQLLQGRGFQDSTLRVTMGAVMLALPFAVAFPLVSAPGLSLTILVFVIFFGTVPFGAGVSIFPVITPNRMRAQVVAIYLLVANLLGYSAGPTAIAWLTDSILADPKLIHYSLAIAPPAAMLLGLVLLTMALAPYRRAMQIQITENGD